MASKHEPRITKNADGEFYALIVRIDRDGEESVIHGFGGHYKSEANALRAATRHIEKHCSKPRSFVLQRANLFYGRQRTTIGGDAFETLAALDVGILSDKDLIAACVEVFGTQSGGFHKTVSYDTKVLRASLDSTGQNFVNAVGNGWGATWYESPLTDDQQQGREKDMGN